MLRPSLVCGVSSLVSHADAAGDEESMSIFAEVVNVHVKPAGRDEFTAALTVRLRPDNPAHPRNLLLEMTDDADLLFYHSLMLGEADFHALKAEQRLRVDFQSFPAQLVELFRRCMGEEGGSSSSRAPGDSSSAPPNQGLRMLAQLDCASNGDSLLSIVEDNQFRELTHISLRLRKGTDDAVKQHLACKLKSSRGEAADLADKFKESQEKLALASKQVDELSARSRVVSEERQHLERSLETAHQREVAELRQESLRANAELQRGLTDERSRMEAELRQSLNSALARATAAERLNEDHQQRHQSLTSTGKSCQERLESAETQLRETTEDTKGLREQVKQLELLKYQHEREIGELRVQVSGLRDQLGAKELLVTNQASQIDQANAQRRGLEESLASCKQQIHALEEKFSMSAQEISKGNQIIQSLHANTKQARAKLKQKASELVRQEKSVLELERAEELKKHVLEEKEQEISRGKDATCRLKEDIEELKKKLSEAYEVLKTNQDVIEYLNRQLTERDLKGMTAPSPAWGTTTTRFAEALGTSALGLSPHREADVLRKTEVSRASPAAAGFAGYGGLGGLGSLGAVSAYGLASGGAIIGGSGGLGAARAAAYGGLLGVGEGCNISAAAVDPLLVASKGCGGTCSAAAVAALGPAAVDSPLLRGPVAYRSPGKA